MVEVLVVDDELTSTVDSPVVLLPGVVVRITGDELGPAVVLLVVVGTGSLPIRQPCRLT